MAYQQFIQRLNQFSDAELLDLTRYCVILSREAAEVERSTYHRNVFRVYSEWARRGMGEVYEAAARAVLKTR